MIKEMIESDLELVGKNPDRYSDFSDDMSLRQSKELC